MFNVPADAHKAHAAISPFLKSSQDGVDSDDELQDDDEDVVDAFFNNWRPSAVLICTRKHDGKSIKLAHFEDLDRDDGINTLVNEDNLGSLCFNIASLRLPHDVAEHFEEITQSVILVFRKDTGHLRYIFSSFHDADVSPVTSDFINMLLHDTMRHYDACLRLNACMCAYSRAPSPRALARRAMCARRRAGSCRAARSSRTCRGSPVADRSNNVPAPGCPVGRGPAAVGFG